MAVNPHRTSLGHDQRGIALVVSLVTMLVLVVLGYGVLVATDASTRAETSLKAQTVAFEAADAGLEKAREKLRACIAGTGTGSPCNTSGGTALGVILNSFRNGNTLVDSTSLSNFGATSATVNGTSNTPFVASNTTDLSPSAYQVFLTNDPTDGVTSATDSNQRVTLTSFASGPNNIGYAIVQSVVEAPLTSLNGVFQATLILPGPDVSFTAPTSNQYGLANSSCKGTIAVTSNAARTTVYNAIPSNRTGNYTTSGCSPSDPNMGIYNLLQPSAQNPYQGTTPQSPTPPTNMPPVSHSLITVSYYQDDLLPKLSAVANFRAPSDAGFTLGSATSPQIVYINGDYDMSASTGYGVLVVTGNFTMSGNSSYNGIILVVGAGNATINGGGNGSVNGTVVVANTNTPFSGDSRYVGIPTYNANGGGTSAWGLAGNLINNIPFTGIASPRRISFQQLR